MESTGSRLVCIGCLHFHCLEIYAVEVGCLHFFNVIKSCFGSVLVLEEVVNQFVVFLCQILAYQLRLVLDKIKSLLHSQYLDILELCAVDLLHYIHLPFKFNVDDFFDSIRVTTNFAEL